MNMQVMPSFINRYYRCGQYYRQNEYGTGTAWHLSGIKDLPWLAVAAALTGAAPKAHNQWEYSAGTIDHYKQRAHRTALCAAHGLISKIRDATRILSIQLKIILNNKRK